MFQTKASEAILEIQKHTVILIGQKALRREALKAQIERLDDPLQRLDLRVEVEKQQAAIDALTEILRYMEQAEAE